MTKTRQTKSPTSNERSAADHLLDVELQWASRYGEIDRVKRLLDAGADIHTGNDLPLLLACVSGYDVIVYILLEAGADIRANCGAALRAAGSYRHVAVTRMLLSALGV